MRRILFVDDHPIYRDGVRRALEECMDGLEVATADGMASALLALADGQDFDLCLTDQRLQDGDGVTLARRVRQLRPSIAVGLLCAEPTLSLVAEARALGAVACLSKDRDPASLAEVIDLLFSGGEMFDDVLRSATTGREISLRRREILVLAGRGLLDKQISDKLGISESTVRNHWQHIFTQLDVSNRTEAVTRALRSGLI